MEVSEQFRKYIPFNLTSQFGILEKLAALVKYFMQYELIGFFQVVDILDRELGKTIIKIERPGEEQIIKDAFLQSFVQHRVGTFHKVYKFEIVCHEPND